jgi:calcium-dependent protein kinase
VVKQGYGSHFPQAIPVSEDVKDLLGNLLVKDPAKRLTAEEALDHVWIRNRDNNNRELPKSVVKGIQAFQKNNRFKDIVCHTFRDKLLTSQVKAVEDSLKNMDKDGDSVISQKEFLEAMKVNTNLTKDEITEIFNLIDTDKSKTICFAELASATYAQHIQAQDERLYAQFTAFDLNGDGYITAEEMQQAMEDQISQIKKKGDTIHFDVEEAKAAMNSVDTNNDGRIDYNEFLAALFPDHNENAAESAPPSLLKGHTDDVEMDG